MIATTTPSLSLASASVLLKSRAGAQPRGGAKVACTCARLMCAADNPRNVVFSALAVLKKRFTRRKKVKKHLKLDPNKPCPPGCQCLITFISEGRSLQL